MNLHQSPESRPIITSYRVSNVLVKHKKPFKDGDIVKQDFSRQQEQPLWALLTRQNCRSLVDVGENATKVKTFLDLEISALGYEILLTLQNDIEIKARSTSHQSGEHVVFWKLPVAVKKHPNLRRYALNLTSLFGSTYLCESAFSHMKIIKSEYRSTMTDDHLVTCLALQPAATLLINRS